MEQKSVRAILYLPSAIFLSLLTGCAVKHPPAPDAVSHSPLAVDDAMQRRQWPISVARNENGSTPAWATGFLLEPRPNAPHWEAAVTDTPIFVANTLAAPFVLFFTPSWEPVIYPRGVVEPSYNDMPPLSR